ncbi:hypothetical protein D8674_038952 [Pyrus ussuriensis x Pyrus communis]|uniref:Mediator complex subunit 15 KIX domain-containing protein n=1 Tax=Pyrus ussuriensis x Pyrus communis TaxID=2448454 RepID=A0A5N5FPT5_9ROSA|nr:hypothetical protein D8674_038952 [Pyrus ussuriensis x Pyrus communis]
MNTNIQTRPPQAGEPPMEAGDDWRTQLQSESRHRIVAKIIETMKRHVPFDGPEGLREIERIAVTFEENMYVGASSQSDYIRKISLKMLTMETKSQTAVSHASLDPFLMDTNIQTRPPEGGEPSMETGDWRSQLQLDSRHRIVAKIMETLKRHLPFNGEEGLRELEKIAARFEEKIYVAASSQSDYLRKISMKMLAMENKPQGGETSMVTSNWRSQLQPDSRHRIIAKITEVLRRHLPFTGDEGLHELERIAVRFEEKIYTVALSQIWVFQFNFVSKSAGVCGWSVLMDLNNQRPAQGGEPSMEAGDWRSQLQQDSRRRIVHKITETLKRHLPFEGEEGLRELEKIAVRFEEKIYVAASSQSDYLRKISLKMLAMETKSQNAVSATPPSNLKRHRVLP